MLLRSAQKKSQRNPLSPCPRRREAYASFCTLAMKKRTSLLTSRGRPLSCLLRTGSGLSCKPGVSIRLNREYLRRSLVLVLSTYEAWMQRSDTNSVVVRAGGYQRCCSLLEFDCYWEVQGRYWVLDLENENQLRDWGLSDLDATAIAWRHLPRTR
jgi:hypothetical protein